MDFSLNTQIQNVAGASASREHQPLNTTTRSASAEVRATLAGFESVYALLNLVDSNELIRWPKSKIPAEAKIGDTLLLEAVSLKNLKDEELKRMRTLLEELIN